MGNPTMTGATLYFGESLDVFSFLAVDKKRALKKEEWPSHGSMDSPNRYDVNVQLMAGNVEIQTCDGCASWKEKTRKPFLVLTPTGDRCVQFHRQPFLLLIFRCCPKFHSCSKQFRLVISVTSNNTGQTYRSDVNIYRKKMASTKKRKVLRAEEEEEYLEAPPNPAHLSTREGAVPYQLKLTKEDKPLLSPALPGRNSMIPMQPVVPPMMMYEVLFAPNDKKMSYDPRLLPPRMPGNSLLSGGIGATVAEFLKPQNGISTSLPPAPQHAHPRVPMIKIEDGPQRSNVIPSIKHEEASKKKPLSFWNYDAFPMGQSSQNTQNISLPPSYIPAFSHSTIEGADEGWLNSVFCDISTGEPEEDFEKVLDFPEVSLYTHELNLEQF